MYVKKYLQVKILLLKSHFHSSFLLQLFCLTLHLQFLFFYFYILLFIYCSILLFYLNNFTQ